MKHKLWRIYLSLKLIITLFLRHCLPNLDGLCFAAISLCHDPSRKEKTLSVSQFTTETTKNVVARLIQTNLANT